MRNIRKPIQPGTIFNGVKVLAYSRHDKHGHSLYSCKCHCGSEFETIGSRLKSGHTSSCGCLQRTSVVRRNTKHGMAAKGSKHPLYVVWVNMRDRCSNPKNKKYANYGGSGITVFPEWDSSFSAFLDGVGLPFVEGFELDRIDSTKGYEPGNTRWVSGQLQNINQSRNIIVDWFGRSVSLTTAYRESGASVNYATLRGRIKRGVPLFDALFSN